MRLFLILFTGFLAFMFPFPGSFLLWVLFGLPFIFLITKGSNSQEVVTKTLRPVPPLFFVAAFVLALAYCATTAATAAPTYESAGYAKVKCNRALKNTGIQDRGWDWSYFKIEVSTMSRYSGFTASDYEYVINFKIHHKGLGLTKLVACIYDVKSKKLIDLAEY